MRPAFPFVLESVPEWKITDGKSHVSTGKGEGRMEKERETWQPLGSGYWARVSPGHTFSTDTPLLSHFSRPRSTERRAVELCAGCGVLSLLWLRKRERPLEIDAVEIQESACLLMRQSVERNTLSGRYRPIQADLRNLKGILEGNRYDLAACNPPYMPAGAGIASKDAVSRAARHEEMCTIEDVVQAAARLLRPSGRLCLCQRPERLCSVMEACRQGNLEPKRLRLVQQRVEKAPTLFLLEARKGARPGGLVVEPTLIIEDGQGGYSQEMREIYGDYARKEETR